MSYCTSSESNVMLSIAQNYSDSFDIKFNISKSLLVAYSKHGMIKCAVTFNNVAIESRAQAKHIRNLVGFNTNLNVIVSGVSDFQRKLNVMIVQDIWHAFIWLCIMGLDRCKYE